MDIRKVFRGISNKLLADFEISAQISHNGNIGDYRENSLREFLQKGRLPKKYGIGTGEIVGHIHDVSRQSDLIVFDQFESIPLLYDSQIQVYPIDCIYGVIEVKSKLSKAKLIEGLENIKSVKELTPNDIVRKKTLFIQQSYQRPKPFGFVFAYSLCDNSLDSLAKNLQEWEKDTPSELWPNLIVLLGEGLIYHTKSGIDKRILSSTIDDECKPTCIHFKKDTFFHFYSFLLDSCSNMELPSVEISKYLDLPQKIGKYVVRHNDRIVKIGKDGKIISDKVYRLTENFIDKVVTWCKANGAITQKELFLKQLGNIPLGMNENDLSYPVYLYNPDGFKGLHEVQDAIEMNDEGIPIVKPNLIAPAGYITVNDEIFYYPYQYVTEDDSEEIKGKTYDDL